MILRHFGPQLLALAAVLLLPEGLGAGPPPTVKLSEVVPGQVHAVGNGRDELQLSVQNTGRVPLAVAVPGGTLFGTDDGTRVVTLRATEMVIPPGETGVAQIPSAALSLRNTLGARQFTLAAASEDRLAGFIVLLASRRDIPRATSQLVILALSENVTFADWQKFSGGTVSPAEANSAPPEIIQALDSLGILRELHPKEDYALAADPSLKLRALRHPLTRPKALALFGMAIPGDGGASDQQPPDLGKLLHMKEGDDCPVCRMRQRGARGVGDF